MKLFFAILGCKPDNRYTEQHDTFFGVGNELKDLLPQINNFWPDGGKIHIDSWRVISKVDDYKITIVPKNEYVQNESRLFFLNLGGYKPNDLEEYHYKFFTVAKNKGEAIQATMQTAFYKHTGFGSIASSHIDDKYGVDVDDIYEIADILPEAIKKDYAINIEKITAPSTDDELNIGYTKLSSLV